MNFTQAVTTVLRDNYANFKGRASRAEFWWYFVFIILVYAIFWGLFALGGGYAWLIEIAQNAMDGNYAIPEASGFIKFLAFLVALFALAVVIPNLAVLTRRFHDRNMSGWWVVGFIAIGLVGGILPLISFIAAIALYVLCALPGTDGDNKYGPKPF